MTSEFHDGYKNEDYPFSSWETFRCALSSAMTSEFYGEEYPKYEAADIDNYDIIKHFAKNYDPQIILDDIIDLTINEGQRYAKDIILGIGFRENNIIDYLLKKGAEFPWSLVFSLPEDEEFEDNILGLQHRATLIDKYAPLLDPKIPEEISLAVPYEDQEYTDEVANICAGYLKANCTYFSE